MNVPSPRAISPAPWLARRSGGPGDSTINLFGEWRPLYQSWVESRVRPRPRAWACIHWTPDALHFRVLFEGAPGSNRARRLNERTWELGDVCEIFLQREGVPEYLEIHVTPDNIRLQLLWPLGGIDRLRSGAAPFEQFTIPDANLVESAVQLVPDAWQVDVAVPARALNLPELDETCALRAAICAYRYPSDGGLPELASTASLGQAAFHQPDHWDRVEVAPCPRKPAKNSAIAPALRADYSPDRLAAWFARHEETLLCARKTDAKIVFAGDSLTAGWLDRGRAAWDRHFAAAGALNFGVAGDRTQQLLWRLESEGLATICPRGAVVWIGINNLHPGLGTPTLLLPNTPEEIIEGIDAVVEAMRRRWPDVEILLLGLLAGSGVNPDRARSVHEINRTLSARSSAGAQFLDLSYHFETEPDAFNPDGIHLTSFGYDLLAEIIAPILKTLMRASG